jgi:hypothetical protein
MSFFLFIKKEGQRESEREEGRKEGREEAGGRGGREEEAESDARLGRDGSVTITGTQLLEAQSTKVCLSETSICSRLDRLSKVCSIVDFEVHYWSDIL